MSIVALLLLTTSLSQSAPEKVSPPDASAIEEESDYVSPEEAAALTEAIAQPLDRLAEMMSWAVCIQDDFHRPLGQGLHLLNDCQQTARNRLRAVQEDFERTASAEVQQEVATTEHKGVAYFLLNRCMNAMNDDLRALLPTEGNKPARADAEIFDYCNPYALYGLADNR